MSFASPSRQNSKVPFGRSVYQDTIVNNILGWDALLDDKQPAVWRPENEAAKRWEGVHRTLLGSLYCGLRLSLCLTARTVSATSSPSKASIKIKSKSTAANSGA